MKEKALESGLFFSERERKMNYTENEIKAVFDKLEEASSIVIFGHKNPDGDCVGSVFGLKKDDIDNKLKIVLLMLELYL